MSENKEQPDGREKLRQHYKKHKVEKFSTELLMKTTIWVATYAIYGREGLKDLKDPEKNSGLIEGAIIGNQLCYPDKAIGALILKQAPAGQSLAFDFNRPDEFPLSAKQEGFSQQAEGVLWRFLPDEVSERGADERTPVRLLDWGSLDHVLTLNKARPEELVDEGLLVRRTHAEAYDYAGQQEYITDLRARSMDTEPVYQVTPKGNTLMNLIPDTGDKTPKRSPQFEFAKAGILAH